MPENSPVGPARDPGDVPPELLERGVHEGIITQAQRDELLALAAATGALTGATSRPAPTPAERAPGLNAVTVAYGIGAMLVLFACGWFLVDRWAKLGAWGVLAVVMAYALILLLATRWLLAHRFQLAADISTMLAVSLAPLAGWSALSMAGRWPLPSPSDPLWHHQVWMAWQWLILDLSLLLAALLVLRKRRIVTLTWPMAVALWATWLHVGQILRGEDGPLGFDRWLMLANGLALLLVAERVERWQRNAGRANIAAGGASAPRTVMGDFANAFWVTGLLATAVAYMALWLRADNEAWQHLLPLFSLGLVALSLFLGRRVVLLFGIAGLLGYLAFLAEDVFKDFVSFPILLAGFGILLILATVWTQTRFPTLVERIDSARRTDERPLPWSPLMAVLPLAVALVMASLAWVDAADEQAQRAFQQRLQLLRMHSGSMNPTRPPRGAAPRRRTSDSPPAMRAGNLPADSA